MFRASFCCSWSVNMRLTLSFSNLSSHNCILCEKWNKLQPVLRLNAGISRGLCRTPGGTLWTQRSGRCSASREQTAGRTRRFRLQLRSCWEKDNRQRFSLMSLSTFCQFWSVSPLAATIRCSCNGRSRNCLRDAWGLHCVDCQGNTEGRHCERCKDGFYLRGAGLSCTPCHCNSTGEKPYHHS